MPSAVRLRDDYSAKELRALARRSKDANQSRRLLSLAAVRDGMDRGAAAKIGGMDRQTLRDWVHRFNAFGPEGLFDNWTAGPKPRLSEEQRAQFAQIVEAGPDREKDGVVREAELLQKLSDIARALAADRPQAPKPLRPRERDRSRRTDRRCHSADRRAALAAFHAWPIGGQGRSSGQSGPHPKTRSRPASSRAALRDEPSARAGSFFKSLDDPLILSRMTGPCAHMRLMG